MTHILTLNPKLWHSKFATQDCPHTQICSTPLIVLPNAWNNCLELGPLTRLSASCPCHQKMEMSCSRQLLLDGTLVIVGMFSMLVVLALVLVLVLVLFRVVVVAVVVVVVVVLRLCF